MGFFMQQYKFSLYSSVDFSLKAAVMVANAWTFPTEGIVIHLFYCTVEIFYVPDCPPNFWLSAHAQKAILISGDFRVTPSTRTLVFRFNHRNYVVFGLDTR